MGKELDFQCFSLHGLTQHRLVATSLCQEEMLFPLAVTNLLTLT